MEKKLTIDLLSRKEDITMEEVRQFERYKNYTDEQVLELIVTIKTYTQIIYNLLSKQGKSGKIFAVQVETEKQLAA